MDCRSRPIIIHKVLIVYFLTRGLKKKSRRRELRGGWVWLESFTVRVRKSVSPVFETSVGTEERKRV